jgi:hypothetical protein
MRPTTAADRLADLHPSVKLPPSTIRKAGQGLGAARAETTRTGEPLMGMLDLLRRRKAGSAAKPGHARGTTNSTQFEASQMAAGSPHQVRKDLLRLALRETLSRNGIPQAWLAADMLRTTSTTREQGLHVRFVLRAWEPRLVLHGPALEQEFMQRLLLLDPQAEGWLMGFSWQFALPDASVCPPLPHPATWTLPPQPAEPAAFAPAAKPGDLTEGQEVVPPSPDDLRADLEQLLAVRDADLKRHASVGDSFAPTRPLTL